MPEITELLNMSKVGPAFVYNLAIILRGSEGQKNSFAQFPGFLGVERIMLHTMLFVVFQAKNLTDYICLLSCITV